MVKGQVWSGKSLRFDDTFALEGNEEDCHVTNKRSIKGRGNCKAFKQDHAWQAWGENQNITQSKTAVAGIE